MAINLIKIHLVLVIKHRILVSKRIQRQTGYRIIQKKTASLVMPLIKLGNMDPKLNYPKVYMNGTTIKGLYSKSDVFFG
jgi:hypothetical protein